MTSDQINNHLLRFQRFQKSRETYFAPKINEALHKEYLTAAEHLRSSGIHAAVKMVDSLGIYTVLKSLYLDAATIYGAKIRADLNKQGVVIKELKEVKNRRPIGFSETMQQLVSDYFHTDLLNTAEGITATTRDLITKVFTEAYAAGLGIDDIVKKLEGTELSKIRARMIARTETVTAANQGALFVAKSTNLKLNKIWLATSDNRTRQDHADINGRKIGRDDYFNVGGYDMLIPGDRGGHDGKQDVDPKEYVNCRCTTIFESIRDANGKLVRA